MIGTVQLSFTPYVLPLLASAGLMGALACYAWIKRRLPGAAAFGVIMAALCEWPVAYALLLAGQDLATKMLWYRVEYLGVVVLSASWIVFVVHYAGCGHHLKPWIIGLLAVEPAATELMALSNDLHHWLWRSTALQPQAGFLALDVTFGWWYWLNVVYSYLAYLGGAIFLVWALARKRRLYKLQAISLVLGLLAPLVGNTIYNTGVLPSLDLAPFAFAVSGVIWWFGLVRFRVLQVVPVATPVVLESMFESMLDAVLVLDTEGAVVHLNPAACGVLGLPAADVMGGQLPAELRAGLALEAAHLAVGGLRTEVALGGPGGRRRHFDLHLSPLYHREGDPAGSIVVLRDVSERKRAEQALAHQARHDALTGLPNRTLLAEQLAEGCQRAARDGQELALLFLDLDNFKTFNDSLGHAAGDELLVALAQRLLACLRPGDLAARLGGDEFAFVLVGAADERAAGEVAARILAALGTAFRVRNAEAYVTASIGIALVGPSARDPESLLRNADAAMYAAKCKGKGRYAFFAEEMHQAALGRLALERELRQAIERGQLEVYYQPVVDLVAGTPVGCEALVRWNHPERGLVSPLDFIALAEEVGLIAALGSWVLREACRTVHDWQLRFGTEWPLVVTVNLSPRQLQDPQLVDHVRHILEETGADPRSVLLEITEGVLLEDNDAVLATLQALRALGVRLALDDFGTGYSALGYLQRFPIDVLKIDRSFVQGLGTSADRVALVRALVALGQALGLRIVAEGIERADQLVALRDLGCEYGQGYLFARPQPRGGVDAFLDEGLTRPRSAAERGTGHLRLAA